MFLVDTSVWIDHFRTALPKLVRALHEGKVFAHPFVAGELALGGLRRRRETIGLVQELPSLPVAPQADVMDFIEQRSLASTGIGWVDAHLLHAAAAAGVQIWTHDGPLRRLAARLRLLAE